MPTIDELAAEIMAASQTYGSVLTTSPFKQLNAKKKEESEMTSALPGVEGFLFGCDPELFILDPDGKPVPADGIIPGTKAAPEKVEFGAVQRDGMAAEFNIDPADNFKDFNRNITAVMKTLEGYLPKGHTLAAIPSVRFTEADFANVSDDAKELGCTPDYDAWTGEVNSPPDLPDDPYLRTASGHLHIGWTEDAALSDLQHILNCRDLVKQLDWFLGGWSLGIDDDKTRRAMYGKAGACRYKPYGVEYRVLSNFWLTSKERRVAVWNRMQLAIRDMRTKFLPERTPKDFSQLLIASINNSVLDPQIGKYCRYPLRTTDASYAQF